MTVPALHLFGIPSCDNVKKARAWFESKSVAYAFQDFKKNPLTHSQLQLWCKQVDWQALVNKKSTTWRNLDPATREQIVDERSACAVLLAYPSLVKRPVVWAQGTTPDIVTWLVVGIEPQLWTLNLGR